MVKTNLKPDLGSCFSPLVMVARRHDLAAIIRESNFFRVIYAPSITLEDVTELQNHDVVLLIVRGKATKSTLTDAERENFLVHVRESNANLN